ncbi:histidine phosphatase family protein [Aquibium carbonis]|uniref:Histidine phosphatase family protein n=1 Tax=Aquibium carbonis TaxID=2495581 RepID=A0A3S0A606_9HYPH|nr:histidine phosphatase family protein [Aquibium carbonis]RST84667.1 histidine phosphatase family protein [Aquibium carbonis]
MIGYYLTHPQVVIDPAVPTPQWPLSSEGRHRTEAILGKAWLKTLRRIVSSGERKAIDTASIIAAAAGLDVEIDARMGENDRSSTGFLEPAAFEAAADCFFAEPETSWNGWERAVDAQARIVEAVDGVLAAHPPDTPILFTGHGAVGSLLKTHLAGRAISRREDQPGGGGNIFAFALSGRALLCDWTPMESFEGPGDDR